jgi:hypothetical protein
MVQPKSYAIRGNLIRICTLSITWFFSACVQAEEPIQFNRDVRPILSQACFRCHGFDAKTREADLRLDKPEDALAHRDGKAAIKPGNLEESLVWQRIHSSDPDLVMPPPSANRQLTADEKKILEKWIQQGATYQQHWAFEPLPKGEQSLDIDGELNRVIEQNKLEKNPIADAATRVRRLAITLTGLPPDPADAMSLSADPSRANYERIVDKYLASPHFGEEMAKHWLDIARYGDTHGLHLDNDRTIWAYRDWVIRAFNANQPFDQFTIDQLAGDLLPNATQDQWIATGFNRCNVTTSEGGAINEEFLFRYAVDRTSTTVQTWLGLTAGCAVCHDHKYDQLSTKEFYSLYAFFYNAADPAMDGNVSTTAPFRRIATAEQQKELDSRIQHENTQREKLLEIARSFERRAPITVSSPRNEPSNGRRSQVWFDDEFPLESRTRNTSRNQEVWRVEASSPMGERFVSQSFGNRFEQTVSGGWPILEVPANGVLQFWVRLDRYEPAKAISISVKAANKALRWTWANSLEDAQLIDRGSKGPSGPLPTPGVWTQMSVSLEGLPAAEVQDLQFGLFGGNCDWDGFVATGEFASQGDLNWEAWWAKQKNKSLPLASGKVSEAIKQGAESDVGKEQRSAVEEYYYAYIADAVSDELKEQRVRWRKAGVRRKILEDSLAGSMVFGDVAKPREAFVMTRGQYDQKGERVEPSTPAILPKLVKTNEGQPSRLDLAKWLVAAENPLTARVTVNRFWQQVFGTGLVKTSDDFGTQGTPPSHPRLLDQLAIDFRDHGWDVKRLMKQLVMTEAFQRFGSVTPEQLNIDPENRFYARGPRIRLDAEQLRDSILAVSGLLNPEMGGPGFKTYQPPNIWEPVGYGDSNTRYYVQDHGPIIYKRSIYAYLKRTAPPPFMTNFDAPNREQFCSRRERSNTPLQALQLMNDIQYMEAARYLASKTIESGYADADAQIQFVFQKAMLRPATVLESKNLLDAYSKFRTRLASAPEDAARIAGLGEKPKSTSAADLDVASLALVVNLVFNLDEFLNRN